MPIYEYACRNGHRIERVRSIADRNRSFLCRLCGSRSRLQISLVHVEPDGIYSYAPNIGSEQAWERRQAAIRERRDGGRGVIEKQDQPQGPDGD